MLCNKEEFQIELSCKIALWQIFVGHRSAWFPLLSACRLIDFDASVICHVFLLLLRLISIASYALKSPGIYFRGTKHEIYHEHAAYLHLIFCAGPGCVKSCLQAQ